jgi:hypothetical protein
MGRGFAERAIRRAVENLQPRSVMFVGVTDSEAVSTLRIYPVFHPCLGQTRRCCNLDHSTSKIANRIFFNSFHSRLTHRSHSAMLERKLEEKP